MPMTTWIRDLLGIPKDIVDLKKTKLEVTKLKAEELARNFITSVSLDDIRKYDPNVQRLEYEIRRQSKLGKGIVAPRFLDVRFRELTIRHPIASALLILIMIAGVIIATIVVIISAIRSVLNWVQ